eukprot:13904256-Heterocapsa_arctica.AAC.1
MISSMRELRDEVQADEEAEASHHRPSAATQPGKGRAAKGQAGTQRDRGCTPRRPKHGDDRKLRCKL